MLGFQEQILGALVEEDQLLICGKGLLPLVEILDLFTVKSGLVILLNGPNPLNSETRMQDRLAAYSNGGLVSVTNQILVVDFLFDRLPVYLVAGIIVLQAHLVTENSHEAFILQIFREKNKSGFIKALSDKPECFQGFARLEKSLKFMQIDRVSLFPRFHLKVCEDLDADDEVLELHQPLTRKMQEVQLAIVQVIESILRTLKRQFPNELDEFSFETALTSAFDFTLKNLSSRLTFKHRQLIQNAKTMRYLMKLLLQSTSEKFLEFLESISFDLRDLIFSASDSFDLIFKLAKERLGEINPKWKLVEKTLLGIDGKVLIACENQDCCDDLSNYLPTSSPEVFISTFDTVDLNKLNPNAIIIFSPNLKFIRQIEIFRSKNSQAKIYFLMFADSIEEQKYLGSIRAEKRAFESLIQAKSQIVIQNQFQEIYRFQKIIVDLREFKSSLPFVLFKRGFELIGATLEVGDYIPSPNVCIERKALPDLIASLNSGRLFAQLTAMMSYKTPVLMIELEDISGLQFFSNNDFDLASKLVLLTLHFPSVRIMWAVGQIHCCQQISLLQRNEPEPSAENLILKEENDAIDLLLKLPGVTKNNYMKLAKCAKNLENLALMTLAELEICMESANAKRLHDFINSPFKRANLNDKRQKY